MIRCENLGASSIIWCTEASPDFGVAGMDRQGRARLAGIHSRCRGNTWECSWEGVQFRGDNLKTL